MDELENQLEAVLFVSKEPVPFDKLLNLLKMHNPSLKAQDLTQALDQLKEYYEARGIQMIEVAGGFCFQTAPSTAVVIATLLEEKPQKYPRSHMEALATIAYKQPITKGEIEGLRGVSLASHVLRSLQEAGWIEIAGHKEIPGRPPLYVTTQQFLNHFGLKSLAELPLPQENL